jgi:hypothetical protein
VPICGTQITNNKRSGCAKCESTKVGKPPKFQESKIKKIHIEDDQLVSKKGRKSGRSLDEFTYVGIKISASFILVM